MSDESPKSLAQRFLHTCLLILGGVIALWLAIETASHIWVWLILGAVTALGAGLLIWWARRRSDRW